MFNFTQVVKIGKLIIRARMKSSDNFTKIVQIWKIILRTRVDKSENQRDRMFNFISRKVEIDKLMLRILIGKSESKSKVEEINLANNNEKRRFNL